MCGYILAINWQNFTEIYLAYVKILPKVLGGYFFDSHCIYRPRDTADNVGLFVVGADCIGGQKQVYLHSFTYLLYHKTIVGGDLMCFTQSRQ